MHITKREILIGVQRLVISTAFPRLAQQMMTEQRGAQRSGLARLERDPRPRWCGLGEDPRALRNTPRARHATRRDLVMLQDLCEIWAVRHNLELHAPIRFYIKRTWEVVSRNAAGTSRMDTTSNPHFFCI